MSNTTENHEHRAPAPQDGYIHGFSPQEQERLARQAMALESTVYHQVNFSGCRRVLEVGCAVGAQTKLLLKRFPDVFVHAVDASASQLARARENLAEELKRGRVALSLADAARLSDPDASHDGAFLCWLLEHAARPLEILREVRRVLAPGGIVHGIEVMNSTFALYPESPAVMKYWSAFNQLQLDFGGDPFIGAKLGNYLREAGFSDIQVTPHSHLFDQRDPAKFQDKINYWEGLLLSAAPQLLAAGRVDEELVRQMRAELKRASRHPRGVFYCTPIKYRAAC